MYVDEPSLLEFVQNYEYGYERTLCGIMWKLFHTFANNYEISPPYIYKKKKKKNTSNFPW